MIRRRHLAFLGVIEPPHPTGELYACDGHLCPGWDQLRATRASTRDRRNRRLQVDDAVAGVRWLIQRVRITHLHSACPARGDGTWCRRANCLGLRVATGDVVARIGVVALRVRVLAQRLTRRHLQVEPVSTYAALPVGLESPA